MEKLTDCFLSVLLLLAVLRSGLAEDKFFGEGGDVTLVLKLPVSVEITAIQWKHGNDLVVEWVKDKLNITYYGEFNGRTTLDINTGTLQIRNMNQSDTGVYSVDINNQLHPERYDVKLIKKVPKPTVEVKPLACTHESKQCTLTCDGNTEEAGPVTYSWKMGDIDWMDEKDRSIIINETIQSVKMFTCRMKNLISEQESDPKDNPFFKEDTVSNVGLAVSLSVLVILAAGAGIVYWKREPICSRIKRRQIKNSNDNNGTQPSPESPTKQEETPLNESEKTPPEV